MDYDRHCAEIVTQTRQLVADVEGADPRATVPSCPDWTLGMLLRHIGGGHRWAEETVRTRATGFLPDDQLRKLDGDDSAPIPAEWFVDGAVRLAETLREAGPDTKVWTPLDLEGTTSFWARRFAYETLVHRADATLTAGTEFAVGKDVAAGAIDEWMELDALPAHFEYHPEKRDLLGPGRTLAFEAADADAAWFVDLTGDVITSRRAKEKATVTVRASLTDLLLVLYRRRSVDGGGVEITGDRELLDFWLGHVGFA